MTCVVGIDPSLTSTGISVIRNGVITALHNVRTKPTTGRVLDRAKRIDLAASQVGQILVDEFNNGIVDLIVMEGPSHNSKFGKPHERGGLWWQIAFKASAVAPVIEVAPTTRAKYGTGKGNSAKSEVLAAVRERYGPLAPEPIRNDDVADAVLMAAMGARALGVPVVGESLSERNSEALSTVFERIDEVNG